MNMSEKKIEVAGTTVYELEFDSWRKGEEQIRNRWYASVQGYKDTPKEELEAVAKLFAAAPELLKSLQNVVEWLSDKTYYENGLTQLQAKTLFNGIIKEISPSIAKATGETK